MKKDMSEDILIKYILGEASPDERAAVDAWVALNSANTNKLEEVRTILESSKRLAQVSPLHETDAWEHFKNLRANSVQQANVVPLALRTNWLRIAAAIVFLIGGGWIAYSLYGPEKVINIQATNTVRIITLPDSSMVYINKNSSISYTGSYNKKREIKLTGEAFFDVKHNEQVPFSVSVNGITVKDIGTAFNIKSGAASTEVIVESGIVEVRKSNSAVRLNPQDRVTIKPGDKVLKVEKNTELLYNYYTNRVFVANKTPLWQLINVLNKAYNVNIKIENDAIRNYPMSLTIKQDISLGKILDVLKLSNPEMQVIKTNQGIVLR